MRRWWVLACLLALTSSPALAQPPVPVTFAWDTAATDPGYSAEIERNGASVHACAVFAGTVPTERRCVASVPPGTATFRVRVTAGGAWSEWSPAVSATVTPGAPPGTFSIRWHDVPTLTLMAFPLSSIVDNFNRADGAIGANWTADQMNVGLDGHDIAGNKAATGVQTYYSGTQFGGNQEAYVTVDTLAGTIAGLHTRIQQPNTASARCYEISWRANGNMAITRVRDAYAVEVDLATTTTTGLASGFKLGARVRGNASRVVVEAYIDTGSGWTLALTGTDTDPDRIVGPGYIGMVSGSPDVGLLFDDFGGGDITVTVDQAAGRFYNDDGDEDGSTALAAQAANLTAPADVNTRIRYALQAVNDPVQATYSVQYRHNGGTWTDAAPPVAFSAPAYSAIGTGASGTTSATPSYPTGITSRSKLFLVVTGRSNTASTAPAVTGGGWTIVSGGDLEGGTGTFAADTGTRRATVFEKDTVTGSESGTITVTLAGTANNTLRASIVRVEVPAGHTASVAAVNGADTSNGTGYSATGGSLSLAVDDLLIVATAQNRDSGTASSRAISASGITFGSITNRRDDAVTNGNDHRHIINTVSVSAGSGTVAPTFSYTISASGSGPTVFVRVRFSVTPVPVVISPSAHIAAAAADATTQRLSGLSGSFTAGKISDDTAGLVVDIGDGGNTELEWSLKAIGTVVANTDTIDLRVVADGAALDAYTNTLTWTIGAGGVTGVLAVTFDPMTLGGVGSVEVRGTAAVTLGGMTLAGLGSAPVSGALAVTLGQSTLAGVGSVQVSGALAATLDPLTLAGLGTVDNRGALAVTLGPMTLAGLGSLPVAGALSVVLDPMTLAGLASADVRGVLAVTLDPMTLTDLGSTVGSSTGTLAATFDPMTLAALGVVDVRGALAAMLDPMTLAGAGVADVRGALATTFGPMALAGLGSVDVRATAALTLAPMTLAGLGSVPVAGVLSVTFDPMTLAGVGSTLGTTTGTLAVTFAPMTLAGLGVVEVRGTAAVTLAGQTLAGLASVSVAGGLSAPLAPMSLAGLGVVDVRGALAQLLAPMAVAGAGSVEVRGALAVTLAEMLLAGLGGDGSSLPVLDLWAEYRPAAALEAAFGPVVLVARTSGPIVGLALAEPVRLVATPGEVIDGVAVSRPSNV